MSWQCQSTLSLSLSEPPSEEGTVWRVADRRAETKGGVSFLEATNLLWAAVLCRARVQAWICMVDNFFWWLWKKLLLG